MKKKHTYLTIAILTILGMSLAHGNRMDRLRWTDRASSNPPLNQSSSLDSTIERFWNVKLAEEPIRVSEPRMRTNTPSCSPARSNHSMEVEQDRNTRERRGYFGINLFNAIPIIDFVHGSVTTDSSDNVKGRK